MTARDVRDRLGEAARNLAYADDNEPHLLPPWSWEDDGDDGRACWRKAGDNLARRLREVGLKIVEDEDGN